MAGAGFHLEPKGWDKHMKTPAHLWIIGVLALLWNAGGVFDFVMVSSRNADYLGALPPAQLAYLDAMPPWVNIFWALGVFGALAGALLLLLRSRFAGLGFAFSFAGIVVNLFYGLFLSEIAYLEIGGGVSVIFTISLILLTLFFWAYSRRMVRLGILS